MKQPPLFARVAPREPTLTEALAALGYRHEPACFGRRRILDDGDGALVAEMTATEAWHLVHEEERVRR